MKDDVKPWDLLVNTNYTTQDTRNTRFDICKGCKHLSKPTYTCKKCGCFMAAKTWLKMAYCPEHYWGIDDSDGVQ
jgi:hypothetical protein